MSPQRLPHEPRECSRFQQHPCADLDQKGVCKMVEMAVEGKRSIRDKLKIGIGGGHG